MSLPFLHADPSRVTFYGYDSGCYMAQQMSIIYSEDVKGISVAACGVYGESSTNRYNEEFKLSDERLTELRDEIHSKYWQGSIDYFGNIQGQVVYAWNAESDTTSHYENQWAIKRLYD